MVLLQSCQRMPSWAHQRCRLNYPRWLSIHTRMHEQCPTTGALLRTAQLSLSHCVLSCAMVRSLASSPSEKRIEIQPSKFACCHLRSRIDSAQATKNKIALQAQLTLGLFQLEVVTYAWKEMDQCSVSPCRHHAAEGIALFGVQRKLVHDLRTKTSAKGWNYKARRHLCEMHQSQVRQGHANRGWLSEI